MPFCHAPWTNIDISPMGEVAPCCKFQIGKYNQRFNVQHHSLDQYLTSDLLKEIKQDFIAHQWPQGCERCQIEETHGIASKRQLDWQRWQQHYQQYDLDSAQWLTASIAFGNTCNLKCITCGPSSSSRWQAEHRDIYGPDVAPVKFYRKDFVSNFVAQTPRLIHLDLPGGEPFLSGVEQQWQLLNHYIDNNQAADISLHYTTNATVFPNSAWWHLWQHFKNVDIQISVDGVGARYEYIRYPADWAHTVTNIKRYIDETAPNLQLSVSHTVSAYNVFYLDEFVNWCYTMGLPTPWLGLVRRPTHMRPTVWPDHVKKQIIEHLNTSKHQSIQSWSKLLSENDDSDNFELFKQKTQQHDQYRMLSFVKTFPELAPFL